MTSQDLQHMRRALDLAVRGRGWTRPNPLVGAVIVRDGKVIGEGWHKALGQPHAEVEALKTVLGDARGATMYITLEPCSHFGRTPPCSPLLVERGIARVVAAAQDPNPLVSGKGINLLRKAGVKVEVGLCEKEARRLNEAFFTYHELQRPFIICKWAMTLDGRIATETGNSRWVTNEKSLAHAHEIRACVDAVMVGIGTVLMDNPMLNVRLEGYAGAHPKRVIADGNLRIPLRAKCLENAKPGECVIATTEGSSKDKVRQLRDAGHTVIILPGRRRLLNLKDMIFELYKLQIQSILCEGGSSLHGSMFDAQLVDKVVAFVAPKIVGGTNAKTAITGWGVNLMHRAVTLDDVTIREFDGDVCVEGYVSDRFRRTKPLGSTTRAVPVLDETASDEGHDDGADDSESGARRNER